MSALLFLFALQVALVSAKTYYDVGLDCYTNAQVLGVSPFADIKMIKKAYYQVTFLSRLYV